MKDLGEVETPRSPLQLKLDELGENIVTYSLRLICFMFILEIVLGSGSTVGVDSNGDSIPDPLTLKERLVKGMGVSISMAVAAIPEGLPICVAVTLALGVKRMAGMNAIVKRNSCVESLGAVGVVCTDKTGTITKNIMEVTQEFNGEEGKR
jgi:P-type Ca2+ transporter type 2C